MRVAGDTAQPALPTSPWARLGVLAAWTADMAILAGGLLLAAFVEAQAKTSFGAAAAGSSATVSSVTIASPSQATVHYEVLLLGTPLLKNQVGTAVYLNGT